MSKEKLVPKLRFEEFVGAKGWKPYTLEEVTNYVKGFAFKSKDYTNSGVRIVRASDLSLNNIKNNGNKIFVKKTLENKFRNYKLYKDEIIITTVGSKSKMKDSAVGRAILIKNNDVGLLNQNLVKIEMKINHNSNFVYANLVQKRYSDYIASIERGNANQANIAINDLWEYKIYMAGFKEQEKVGTFLKNIDEMIQLQQSKVNKVKDIKSAYLSEMFPKEGEKYPKKRFEGFTEPWQKRKLDSIANNFDTLRVPVTAADRIPGDIPYYGANGIQDYVEGYTHDGEYILLAEDGANDLNDYPVHYVNGKVWVNNHAHVLQGNSGVLNNRFLMYKLKTVDMEPYLVGGGRAKLNANVMMSIEIALPSIEEQEKIGKFFKNLGKQISNEEEKLAKLEKLKQGYLNDMFV